MHYITIQKVYNKIRQNISIYLEKQYDQNKVVAYEEYLYIEKTKLQNKSNIFEAKNFITFEYNSKVFSLLMPSLSRYKEKFLDDDLDEIYYKEFSKFMMFNKISKLKREQTLIHQFWYFFEEKILKYKGIKDENFFYYLKEYEFKFNYTIQDQYKILISIV
jgi:hypothetical protein